jgi:L-iditol 2-dehydrogenase
MKLFDSDSNQIEISVVPELPLKTPPLELVPEVKTTRAAVLQGNRMFKFEERQMRPLEKDEVLIRMKKVGICGSDVHYYAHGKCGTFETNGKPLILGHESAGIIEEVGSNVKTLVPGDRVAIEPGVPCRFCNHCKEGRYNLCRDISFLATPPVDGSLSTFHIHPADFCFKLPDSVTLEEGALLEPLSVAMHAMSRLGVSAGSCVLITGAGPIGLVCVEAAKACGASFVVVSDIRDERLALASQFGASLTLRADFLDFTEKLSTLVPSIDVTIECSGVEKSVETAIKATRSGGKIGLIGRCSKSSLSVPVFEAADREIDIIGIFRYANCYKKAMNLLASKQISLKGMVTHHFSIDEISEAFEVAETGRGGAIKVMFDL